MIRSMTGFGRSEASDENRKFTVEMKSVNHRYFDVNIRMPKKLLAFESAVRSILKEHVERGKMDVFVNYEDLSQHSAALCYNQALAKEYVDYFQQISSTFALENDMTVSTLVKCPEVLVMQETPEDQEELWKLLETAVREALEHFLESRAAEGDHLHRDLLEKLDRIEACVEEIENDSPGLVEEYRAKLESKIREVLGDLSLDEGRLATEVTIFADKVCVDEETVRLKSHIRNMRETLNKGGAVGKKLDFIAQEMNREANTILSKSGSLDISNSAIILKTEIEKVREQIQNLE